MPHRRAVGHATIAIALGTATLLAACAGAPAPTGSSGLAVTISPLTLPGVTRAVFTLTVANAAGDTVMTRQLDSLSYGAPDGGVAYVAPCDADSNDNVVTLTVDALYAGSGGTTPIGADTWVDPGAVHRDVTCRPNADVAVTFDLTVLRAAQQGFFDIAVNLSDVFCSAKKLCGSPRSGDSLRAFHQPRGQHDERGDPEQA